MAINTQQRRMSAAGVARPWMRAVFPVASPTAAWRQNVGMAYAGLTIAAAAVATDLRTIAGRIIVAFTDGDKFRIRAVRTAGGSDLQTAANGSALQSIVYRN